MLGSQTSDLHRYITAGLLVSLLIHVALALYFNPLTTPTEVQVINVDFIPTQKLREPENQKRQIVTPPESSEQTPPTNSRLLSDKNFSTTKEQIKRGDDPQAGKQLNTSQAAPAANQLKQLRKSSAQKNQPMQKMSQPQKLKSLKLDAQTLREKFSQASARSPKTAPLEEELKAENQSSIASTDGYQAFSRPSGSGAAFLGLRGSPDYLPNLPDGDITLLNAKASRFAVFVRRVATQVFAALRAQGWDQLQTSDINQIIRFATVRATLSAQGKLIEVLLESPSGSLRFDQVLLAASQSGARDPNPPKEAAAADGTYRFIFQSRSWARMAFARNGAPTERRWLLLATGLE